MNRHPGLKFVAIILILSISLTQVGQLFYPNKVSAQTSPVVRFLGCTGVAQFINILINEGLQFLNDLISRFFNWLLGRLPIPGFAGEVPVEEDDVQRTERQEQAKETVADIIVSCLAREILEAINNDILDTVRGAGRNGGVAFVRNWRNFQTDAQYRGEDVFRSIMASTNLCPHMEQELRTVFNVSQSIILPGQNTRVGNLDPYQFRAGCNLPSGFNVSDLATDFANNGGWEALLRLHQPQNNFYHSILTAGAELAAQRSVEESGDTLETIGHGFTSARTGNSTTGCLVRGPNGRCITYKEILTPASILQLATDATVKGEIDWVVRADELNELIATGIEILFNRIRDLSNPNEGTLIVPDYGRLNRTINITVTPIPPTATPTPPNPGGVCADQGGNPDYQSQLQAGIDFVNTNNPGGIADALNTVTDSLIYLSEVANYLQGIGLSATTNVLNGNDQPNRGDLLAIWTPGDPTIERYDVIIGVGGANTQLRNAATSGQFTGDIPLSCIY